MKRTQGLSNRINSEPSHVSVTVFSIGKNFLIRTGLTAGSGKLVRPRTISGLGILSLLVLSFLFVPMAKAAPTVVTAVPVGGNPQGVAYDSGKREVFATNEGSDAVNVISDVTPNLVATVNIPATTAGLGPYGVAYDSGKGEVFVTNYHSNNITVISDVTNTVVATIKGDRAPYGLAYDSGTGEIFVANNFCNNSVPCHLSVISDVNNTVVATVNLGLLLPQAPNFVAYDSGTGQIYVTAGCLGCSSNIVAVVSDVTNTVVATINVGTQPYGVAYDSGKGEVFVANYYSNSVTVIADSTYAVIATIPVGTHPYGLAYDSGTGQVFVANEGSNTVSVISDETNAVLPSVNVATQPHGVAYDNAKGWIFVANYLSGSVTVISDGSLIPNFSISGNPSSVSTTAGSSGSSTITVTGSNGFTGTVVLSQNGGTSCSYSATSLTLTTSAPSGSVTLTCTYATVGSNIVTLTGASGSLSHTATVSFNVGGVPDFILSASPTGVTVLTGVAGTSMIEVTALNGFTGMVGLTASVSSGGLTCTVTPTSVSLGTTGSSMLSCNGTTGEYIVTVVGSSGSLSQVTTVSFAIPLATMPLVSQSITSGGVAFGISSNSTISNLQYDAATHQISFEVSGGLGTGVTNMTVPKSVAPSGGSFRITFDSAASTPNISQDANNYYIYMKYPSDTRTVFISYASPSTPDNAASTIFGLAPSIFTAILGVVGTILSAVIGLAYRARSKKSSD